jgi:GR25 family glycosyltransferase involved in LPS biosynthesis
MFSDHFEQAFCINLDNRKDRWKASEKQFKKIGLDVERVSGVNGFEEPPSSIRPGEVGCLKSHLKVFELAKERNLKSFLMLEDDVEFSDNFHERFNIIEPQLKSYEMLYFGSNPHSGERHEVSPNLNRITYTFAAHCVIFKDTCFDDIIQQLNGPMLAPVDVVYGRQQVVHTAYSIKPALAWQRKDFSDINQEVVDYQFLRG